MTPTWMMFLPARQVVQVVMDPPQSLAVIINPLRLEPLGRELPDEEIAVVEVFVPGIFVLHCGRGGGVWRGGGGRGFGGRVRRLLALHH